MHDRRPVRILFKGASLTTAISATDEKRHHRTFPFVVEHRLKQAGHDISIAVRATAGEDTSVMFRDWEKEVQVWRPDVIVTTHGFYEAMHLLMPRRIERHAHDLNRRPTPLRRVYRRIVLGPLWKFGVVFQQRLDRIVQARGFLRTCRRVSRDLEQYVRQSRKVGKPLIVLFEWPLPMSNRAREWFPGMEPRVKMVNAAISALVQRIDDDDVRLFRVRETIDRALDPAQDHTPDGFHYTPELHEAIGNDLSAMIDSWLHAQT
jgi:hypothetical protein